MQARDDVGTRIFILHLSDRVNAQEFRRIMESSVEKKSIRHFFTVKSEEVGIVDVDYPETAIKIKELFHGQTFYGNTLEVKIMGHHAKIWVGRLCPAVSNEYLRKAFETFGKVLRARVVATAGGKSCKWGFVEFADPQSAQSAVQTCDENCFMLTRSGPPVQVEFWNNLDEFYGIRGQFSRLSESEKQEIKIAPRLAEKGAFEYAFAKRWKDLASRHQKMKDDLHERIMAERTKLFNEHREALNQEEKRRSMPKVNSAYHNYHHPGSVPGVPPRGAGHIDTSSKSKPHAQNPRAAPHQNLGKPQRQGENRHRRNPASPPNPHYRRPAPPSMRPVPPNAPQSYNRVSSFPAAYPGHQAGRPGGMPPGMPPPPTNANRHHPYR